MNFLKVPNRRTTPIAEIWKYQTKIEKVNEIEQPINVTQVVFKHEKAIYMCVCVCRENISIPQDNPL